ncbi:MAG: phosphatidylglycerophosphatase [Anaerosolibacter sp.]|uniref:phosphatase PAP2 family protein n=1 Tax=Anaerosolibacter sp. TaxID=1872527 RepID=UPI002625483A|nr:phosphatase PAP2 family protein [Anaerosolibacter sp.]MDF2546656.1 phosphatidylglycerophosphatase [Anaerosolibacter sp.]
MNKKINLLRALNEFKRYAFIGMTVALLLLFIFIQWMNITLIEKRIDHMDQFVMDSIHKYYNPALTKIALGITYLGVGKFYVVLCLVLFWLLYRKRNYIEMIALTTTLLGGYGLNELLKAIIQRERPNLYDLVEKGFSFPSGHAMVSLCFYGMAAYLISRNTKESRWRWVVGIWASLLIAAIGLTRIYLGVHWFSDIVAGFIGGSIWLICCIVGTEVAHRAYGNRNAEKK